MTTIENGWNINRDFTMIPNEIARNPNFTPRAFRVLVYLMSHVEGWRTSTQQIAAAVGMGAGTVKAAVRDLVDGGYLVRRQEHSDAGHFAAVVYRLVDPTAGQKVTSGSTSSNDTNSQRAAGGQKTAGGDSTHLRKRSFQQDQENIPPTPQTDVGAGSPAASSDGHPVRDVSCESVSTQRDPQFPPGNRGSAHTGTGVVPQREHEQEPSNENQRTLPPTPHTGTRPRHTQAQATPGGDGPTTTVTPAEPTPDSALPATPEANHPTEAPPSADTHADDFAEFWAAYPRPVAYADARRAYMRARQKADHATVMTGLYRSVKTWQAQGRDVSKIPYPARWLRGQCWRDGATTSVAVSAAFTTTGGINAPGEVPQAVSGTSGRALGATYGVPTDTGTHGSHHPARRTLTINPHPTYAPFRAKVTTEVLARARTVVGLAA